MKRNLSVRSALCATIVASLAATQAAAQSGSQQVYEIDDSSVQPAQYSSIGGGYGGGGLGFDLLDNGCAGQFYAGGDYLYVRADYSQAVSYVAQDLTNPQQPTVTYNQFDFDYDSSYRAYAGYRLCECGGDLRFTYTNLSSDASFQSPTVPANQAMRFYSPLEVVADLPGTSLSGRASVDVEAYDITFAKTIPLGGMLGGGCCGDVCDGGCDAGGCCGDGACGGGCGSCCPAWDITWRGGVRIANVDSQFVYDNAIPQNTALEQTTGYRQTFDGAGLRWGMTGRRYLGRRGIGSIYIKGDLSLLLGEHTVVADSIEGTSFARHEMTCDHIIPVTEIEAGGTVCLTDNITVSGGYMFSAWHDLGSRLAYPFSTQPTGVQLESFDDANILGFDGFFVRGQVAF